MHWACTKITSSLAMSDTALLSLLLDKVDLLSASCFYNHLLVHHVTGIFIFQLKLCKGIDYARVAEHADKSGRRKLAAALVEHEPCPSKQVFAIQMLL